MKMINLRSSLALLFIGATFTLLSLYGTTAHEYLLVLANQLTTIATTTPITPSTPTKNKTQTPSADQIKGAIIGAALGDALGGVTEFAISYKKLKAHAESAQEITIKNFVEKSKLKDSAGKQILYYTDDTIMAIPVLEACILGRLYNWNDEHILSAIARGFVFWVDAKNDTIYAYRSHGSTSPRALRLLQHKITKENTAQGWWQREDTIPQDRPEIGCGSVMRAWPIGLVFYDDIDRVARISEMQSNITHRDSSARAACVALATGVAYASQASRNTAQDIAQAMIASITTLGGPLNVAKITFSEDTAEMFFKEIRTQLAEKKLTPADMLWYVTNVLNSPTDSWALPNVVLGDYSDQMSLRTNIGGLLGWVGDEAAAAALYVFLRYADTCNTWQGIQEAVWTVGDSDSVATLAGALLGAYCGLKLPTEAENEALKQLENYDKLIGLATYLSELLAGKDLEAKKTETDWQKLLITPPAIYGITVTKNT